MRQMRGFGHILIFQQLIKLFLKNGHSAKRRGRGSINRYKISNHIEEEVLLTKRVDLIVTPPTTSLAIMTLATTTISTSPLIIRTRG